MSIIKDKFYVILRPSIYGNDYIIGSGNFYEEIWKDWKFLDNGHRGSFIYQKEPEIAYGPFNTEKEAYKTLENLRMKSNFTMKLEELKNTVGVQKTDELPSDKPVDEVSSEEFSKSKWDIARSKKDPDYRFTIYKNDDGDWRVMDPNGDLADMGRYDKAEARMRADKLNEEAGFKNFSNKDELESQIRYCEEVLRNPNGTAAMNAKSNYGKDFIKQTKLDLKMFKDKLAKLKNFSEDRHYWNWYAYDPENKEYRQGVSDADTEDKVREEVKKEHPTWKITKVIDPLKELRGFSEESINIDVKDEATARAYGEGLAKDVFGDKFDQKIFDGVFASALEKCGDDWNAVAAYLKNCYTNGNANFSKKENKMKNFSERLAALEESVGIEPIAPVEPPVEPAPVAADTTTPAVEAAPKPETPDEGKEVVDTEHAQSTPAPVEPMNLSEEAKTTTKAEEQSPAPETSTQNEEVKDTEHADSKEAPTEKMNLSHATGEPYTNNPSAKKAVDNFIKSLSKDQYDKISRILKSEEGSIALEEALTKLAMDAIKNFSEESKTPACPKCGKDPCECQHLESIQLDFTDLMTPEEIDEVKTEAKEITKYPEQYGNTSDQVQAFSDWLQNSRFNDFCKEAIFKAFCK